MSVRYWGKADIKLLDWPLKVWVVVPILDRWKQWARTIRRDAYALYRASRDPRVPWYAKAVAIGVAAYALSTIDLIPDFVPVLGYVDDLVILPAGIALAVRLIPPEIMAQHRNMAAAAQDRPVSRAAGVAIVSIWALAIVFAAYTVMRFL
jgi:uncharacterized membrane protein YkvA (DUF1232 family)